MIDLFLLSGTSTIKKIAVIGAGPAGLSCAYYLAVDGYNVTVFEKQSKLGGMLTLGIPSFRLEKDVVNAEIEILRELGVDFKTGVEVGKDIKLPDLRSQGFEAFYIAIGAQGGKKLNIEGEDASGVIAGVDFLRNVNLGNQSELNGKVVVIGGGNVAIDVARVAVRENSENVSMYCLENRDEMPALNEEIAEAETENISINSGWGPKRIIVENGKVKGVEFKKCISVFDSEHRFNPRFDENDTILVVADYVLVSVGQTIEWGNLLNGEKVELGRGNSALADNRTYQTSQDDVFVGGDVYTGPKFAIDAIAAGKEASISIHRFVWEGQSLTAGRDRRNYHAFNKGNIIIESYDNSPRQRPVHDSTLKKTFNDERKTFTEEQMKKEAERCLGCGAAVVDSEMCIGCGQCTTKCKFDAIKLDRVLDIKGTTFEKIPMKMAPNLVKKTGKVVVRATKDLFSVNK